MGISGVSENWEIRGNSEIPELRKNLLKTPEESGDLKILESRKISGIRITRKDRETPGISESSGSSGESGDSEDWGKSLYVEKD